MKKKSKIILLVLGTISVVLLLTNPSMKQFKEFVGNNENCRRVNNFLIVSTYEYDYNEDKKIYLGFFMNFIDITKKPLVIIENNTSQKDSLAVAMPMVDTITHRIEYDEYGVPIKKNKDPLHLLDTTKDGLPILKKK